MLLFKESNRKAIEAEIKASLSSATYDYTLTSFDKIDAVINLHKMKDKTRMVIPAREVENLDYLAMVNVIVLERDGKDIWFVASYDSIASTHKIKTNKVKGYVQIKTSELGDGDE